MSDALPRRIITAITAHPWAIEPAALEQILDIAHRETDIEAVAARLGRPLQNTRSVSVRDGVAVVPVRGPMFRYANLFTDISGATSVEDLATDLQTALDDPAIRGIVLEVDSPGGQASGISEMAAMVRAASQKKPLTAYVSDLSASAAYWLSSAAGEVVIGDTARLGSIGVVISGSRRQDGRWEIVSSHAPRKRLDPDSDTGRAELLRQADALESVFVQAVADYRGVSTDTVLARFGQGGLLLGSAAVDAGMADRLGTLESVIAGLSAGTHRNPRGFTMTTPTAPAVSAPDTLTLTRTDLDTQLAAAREAGAASVDRDAIRRTEASAERARIAAILDSEAATSRQALARHLALQTDTTPEAAAAILQAASAEPAAARASRLDQAMAAVGTPGIRAEEGASATGSRAQQAVAAYRTAHGIRPAQS